MTLTRLLFCGALLTASLVAPGAQAQEDPVGGGRIAFGSARGGDNEDIFIRDPDGTERRLAVTSSDERDPQLSPDGAHVLFTRNDDIYVADVSGTNVTNLTNDASYDGYPTWRPDGSWIAWVSSKGSRREASALAADLVIARIASDRGSISDRTRLTGAEAGAAGPSWSVNDEIAIAMLAGAHHQIFTTRVDLSSASPSATPPVQLTRGKPSLAPAFSPDGNVIAFHTLVRLNLPDVFTMNRDGSGLLNLTDAPKTVEAFPSWSPSGARLVVSAGPDSAALRLAVLDVTSRRLSAAFTPGPGDRKPHWGVVAAEPPPPPPPLVPLPLEVAA